MPNKISVDHPTEVPGEDAPPSAALSQLGVSVACPTRRAILIGLAIALLLCAITPYNDYFVAATYLSGNFFPVGALGAVLMLVLLVNPVLIRLRQHQAIFTPTEIMTVWAMIISTVGISSSGLMRYLIPQIVAPHYYASPTNGWEALLISHVPSRLLVHDPTAERAFFEGLPRGAAIPWSAWAEPLFWWGLFVIGLFLVFFCLSALLRRQWVEHERFTFPLVTLPILLAARPEPGRYTNSLLRSPLLWSGAGLVTVLHTIKGLHQLAPAIPDITTVVDSSSFITDPPWSSINNIAFAVYPLVIGCSYLLSREVCFSLWFFYLVAKCQVLLGTLYNWNFTGGSAGICMGPANLSYQEAGGAMALVGWIAWSMRGHLKAVWRKAVFDAGDLDDSREPLSYRFSLFGLAGGGMGLFLWMTLVAQIEPFMALGVLFGGMVIFVMLSWLVAQAGLLFAQQAFVPSQVMTSLAGTQMFDAGSLLAASIVEHVGWFDARELMMPSLLNSWKGASEVNLDARSLAKALALSIALAVPVSAIASIWLPYTHGGGMGLKNIWGYIQAPQTPLWWAASQVQTPQLPDLSAAKQIAGGATFVLLLFGCRSLIPSFGLHPAGFLVAATYPMYTLWFSLLIGWLLKTPIVRYGGIQGYRRALPFFLGLIFGDCINALVWIIVGLATGRGYSLLPG